ncbi:MAG: AMIN domain-containing protein [Bdellovibrionales bacterium]|nr:AMIN domain-containing protein [Bdellovibrionales bacterium]
MQEYLHRLIHGLLICVSVLLSTVNCDAQNNFQEIYSAGQKDFKITISKEPSGAYLIEASVARNSGTKIQVDQFKAFEITNPPRLVVDIPRNDAPVPQDSNLNDKNLSKIRFGRHANKIRIVLDLNSTSIFSIETKVTSEYFRITLTPLASIEKNVTLNPEIKTKAIKPKPNSVLSISPPETITTTTEENERIKNNKINPPQTQTESQSTKKESQSEAVDSSLLPSLSIDRRIRPLDDHPKSEELFKPLKQKNVETTENKVQEAQSFSWFSLILAFIFGGILVQGYPYLRKLAWGTASQKLGSSLSSYINFPVPVIRKKSLKATHQRDSLLVTYLQILNLDENASVEEIKKRYRTLAKEFHADTFSPQGASETLVRKAEGQFQVIQEAYDALMQAYRLH